MDQNFIRLQPSNQVKLSHHWTQILHQTLLTLPSLNHRQVFGVYGDVCCPDVKVRIKQAVLDRALLDESIADGSWNGFKDLFLCVLAVISPNLYSFFLWECCLKDQLCEIINVNGGDSISSSAQNLEGVFLFKGLFEIGEELIFSHSIDYSAGNKAPSHLFVVDVYA